MVWQTFGRQCLCMCKVLHPFDAHFFLFPGRKNRNKAFNSLCRIINKRPNATFDMKRAFSMSAFCCCWCSLLNHRPNRERKRFRFESLIVSCCKFFKIDNWTLLEKWKKTKWIQVVCVVYVLCCSLELFRFTQPNFNRFWFIRMEWLNYRSWLTTNFDTNVCGGVWNLMIRFRTRCHQWLEADFLFSSPQPYNIWLTHWQRCLENETRCARASERWTFVLSCLPEMTKEKEKHKIIISFISNNVLISIENLFFLALWLWNKD